MCYYLWVGLGPLQTLHVRIWDIYITSLTFWECKSASVTISRTFISEALKSHVWNTCTTLFVFLGQLDELDNVPALTVSIVWLFPVHLVSKALNLDVSARNTCATLFGFLGQLDELDNISDICVPPQTISIHCLFDNCTTVWDTASCLIHRIDFLIIASNVSVDFFYLKTCLTLLWCSTRSLTLCTTERYCLNIYMYTSFN